VRVDGWLWLVVPLVGGLGSVVLCALIIIEQPRKDTACEDRFTVLMQAVTPYEVRRAQYLIDKAGCDIGKSSVGALLRFR
jgi:hypothetical protein